MEIKVWKAFTKEEQKKLKKIFKKASKCTMPVPQKSLLEQSRYFYDDNEWDRYNEYGFLGYNLTDEEINEIVEEMWLRIYSPYDCTGKHFTLWINTHRNPSGLVSFVHRIGVDV